MFNFLFLLQSFSSKVCSMWASHSALWGENLLLLIPSGEKALCLRSCSLPLLTPHQDECPCGCGETIASTGVLPFKWSSYTALEMWPFLCLITQLIPHEPGYFITFCTIILLLALCRAAFPSHQKMVVVLMCSPSGTDSLSYLEEMALCQSHLKCWEMWYIEAIQSSMRVLGWMRPVSREHSMFLMLCFRGDQQSASDEALV